MEPELDSDAPDAVASEETAVEEPARRRRLWRRWWVLGPLAVVALVFAYFLFNLYDVWNTGNQDQARPVDAIVVLGAAQYDGRPSPVLAARLDHVVELWNKGYAPYVVVTGGKQPADRFTEAEASTRYLVARGVPATAILSEDQGRTSWQSMQGVARLLTARSLTRVLLVSDPYHIRRLKGMAGELGLKGYGSPTRTSPIKGWDAFKRHLKEAAGVGLARFVGYGQLVRFEHK